VTLKALHIYEGGTTEIDVGRCGIDRSRGVSDWDVYFRVITETHLGSSITVIIPESHDLKVIVYGGLSVQVSML